MQSFWQALQSPSRPDPAKLSLFTGLLALVLVLARLVQLPGPRRAFTVGEVQVTLALDAALGLAVLLAALTWTGMDWLLRDHPAYRPRRLVWHALLPTFALWALEAALLALPVGPMWWFVFGAGLAALVVVLLAEFVVLDPQDPRALWAGLGLQAVAYGLYLLLALAVRAAGWRLLFAAPLLAVGAWVVARRLWALRSRAPSWWADGVVLVVMGHLSVAWFYAPLGPLAYSLVLLGALYALVPLLAEPAAGRPWNEAWTEPLATAAGLWLLAVVLEWMRR
ncbi:MAG: hypothetical protein GXO37_05410 [Chloroflexi bacterium]|nr:hypothetical protein [Chloroflexota bacterium]